MDMTDLSPEAFVDAAVGYQKTAAIKAAVSLDLFSKIGSHARTVQELAEATSAAPRGIRILCDYLTVHGFLAKTGQSYSQRPSTQAFLDKASPAYMGSVADFLCAPELMSLFLADPVAYVRNGGVRSGGSIVPDNPMWVTFVEAMMPFAAPAAAALSELVAAWPEPPGKVLDIAAGHGLFGIAIARRLPGSQIVALDWANVLAVARRNADRAGVSDRYTTLPGSAFDIEWGQGFDLVLLTNFLHHFDEREVIGLLAKARASLAPAGRVVAVEIVPNEDRLGPPMPASFPFVMLATTRMGDAYTAAEFDAMARGAGFRGIRVTPAGPTPQSFVMFE
jgi:2-polyprenyl-3-methyl-5-hydroxy-6-metoxy-1,4-benzoquinol methylase